MVRCEIFFSGYLLGFLLRFEIPLQICSCSAVKMLRTQGHCLPCCYVGTAHLPALL